MRACLCLCLCMCCIVVNWIYRLCGDIGGGGVSDCDCGVGDGFVGDGGGGVDP